MVCRRRSFAPALQPSYMAGSLRGAEQSCRFLLYGQALTNKRQDQAAS